MKIQKPRKKKVGRLELSVAEDNVDGHTCAQLNPDYAQNRVLI